MTSSSSQSSVLLSGSEQSMRHLHVIFFFFLCHAGEKLSLAVGTRGKDPLKQYLNLLLSVMVPDEKKNSLAPGNIFGGLSCV